MLLIIHKTDYTNNPFSPQGIRAHSSNARKLLPRVLWLLSQEEDLKVAEGSPTSTVAKEEGSAVPHTDGKAPSDGKTVPEAKEEKPAVEAKPSEGAATPMDVKEEGTPAGPRPTPAAPTGSQLQHPFAVAFDTYSENVPVWVWIAFLPYLFSSLPRPMGSLFKGILAKIATLYPQVPSIYTLYLSAHTHTILLPLST